MYMDKHEAERLATAIRHALVDWIWVQAVEGNLATNTYEIQCSYKQKARVSSLLGLPLDDPPGNGSIY
jgi:hypothetical protein